MAMMTTICDFCGSYFECQPCESARLNIGSGEDMVCLPEGHDSCQQKCRGHKELSPSLSDETGWFQSA